MGSTCKMIIVGNLSYMRALNVSVIPDPIGNPEIFKMDSRFHGNDNIEDYHRLALT